MNKTVTTITTAKAINMAMRVFEHEKHDGDIRTIALQEASGRENAWTQVSVHIGYAVNGDYTESDNNPFIVNVCVRDGKVISELVGGGK